MRWRRLLPCSSGPGPRTSSPAASTMCRTASLGRCRRTPLRGSTASCGGSGRLLDDLYVDVLVRLARARAQLQAVAQLAADFLDRLGARGRGGLHAPHGSALVVNGPE